MPSPSAWRANVTSASRVATGPCIGSWQPMSMEAPFDSGDPSGSRPSTQSVDRRGGGGAGGRGSAASYELGGPHDGVELGLRDGGGGDRIVGEGREATVGRQ